QHLPTSSDLNPKLIAAVARHFTSQGYKVHGEWLHGQCIYPHRHRNGDSNPSFGYNTVSGYGNCYVCGTILSKDICEVLGIRPDDHGGLMQKPEQAQHYAGIDLAAVPQENP